VYELFKDLLPLIIGFGVPFVAWLLLRNKATKLDSAAEFDGRIGQGKPVVLKFFKNT